MCHTVQSKEEVVRWSRILTKVQSLVLLGEGLSYKNQSLRDPSPSKLNGPYTVMGDEIPKENLESDKRGKGEMVLRR